MANRSVCDCEVIHEEAVSAARLRMADREKLAKLAGLYKMFSDATRVRILWALQCGELCVCDLAALLGMTKSAVSHQLKSLRMSNLVKFRRDGKVVYYSLADVHVEDILRRGFEHICE